MLASFSLSISWYVWQSLSALLIWASFASLLACAQREDERTPHSPACYKGRKHNVSRRHKKSALTDGSSGGSPAMKAPPDRRRTRVYLLAGTGRAMCSDSCHDIGVASGFSEPSEQHTLCHYLPTTRIMPLLSYPCRDIYCRRAAEQKVHILYISILHTT